MNMIWFMQTKPVLTSPIVQTTEKTEVKSIFIKFKLVVFWWYIFFQTGTDSTNNHLLTVEKVEVKKSKHITAA